MAGVFYDPRVFAWGDAVGAGLDAYSQEKDNQLKGIQRQRLYNELARENETRSGLAEINKNQTAGLYSPQITKENIQQPTPEVPTYDPMGLTSGTVAPPTETVQRTTTTAPKRSMLTDLKDMYVRTGNVEKAMQIDQMAKLEQQMNTDKYLKIGQLIHYLGQAGKDSGIDSSVLMRGVLAPMVKDDPVLSKIDWGQVSVKRSTGLETLLSGIKSTQGADAPFDISYKIRADGSIETTIKPKKEGSEPKGEFETFKAGIPKEEGESSTAWNARVAKLWDERKQKGELLTPEQEAQQTRIAGARATATEQAKAAGGFTTWSPEAKNQTFTYNLITGKPPVNAAGLGGNDRKAYGREYAQWQVDRGIKPQDISLMQADYRAGDMSLKNMTKQEAPMSAFVLNINRQIGKVEELYSKDDRLGLRMLDLPIRELRVRAKGSGNEAVKASYLLEISNEIGKLSSGASGSVQQLSDSAKEDWKKVHDVNLSMKEIMKVVNATRDQANMRMTTWREAKEEVRNQLRGIGASESPAAGGGSQTVIRYDAKGNRL